MSWRTVIIANHAKLDLQVGFLQIRGENGSKRVILDEIDILLIESTSVSLTTALLAELIERKVKVIFCDRKHLPLAELIPYRGCHDSSRRLKMQLAWRSDIRADVWRTIICAKITRQADVLKRNGRCAELLYAYAQTVEPGDVTNREALAAKSYFTALFGSDFTREKPCAVNSALDYGYQLLLSVFARELTAEGYVLQLGIFHDNVYNGFNLASDLMEPFRPFADAIVLHWFEDATRTFDTELKRRLAGMLHDDVLICGERQTLVNAAVSYTRSVTEALTTGNLAELRFPEV